MEGLVNAINTYSCLDASSHSSQHGIMVHISD